MLYGSGDQEPQTELTAQLAQEFYNHDMLVHLIDNMPRLDFEVQLLWQVLVHMKLYNTCSCTLLLAEEG